MSSESPDYLAGDESFLGEPVPQEPIGLVVDASVANTMFNNLAFTAPNSWPVPPVSNPRVGEKLKQAADWTTRNLQNIATVSSEILSPGSTGYQVGTSTQNVPPEEEKKWGALEWSLVAGGAAVVGVGLYLLFSKDSK